jgi:hypothetical protein
MPPQPTSLPPGDLPSGGRTPRPARRGAEPTTWLRRPGHPGPMEPSQNASQSVMQTVPSWSAWTTYRTSVPPLPGPCGVAPPASAKPMHDHPESWGQRNVAMSPTGSRRTTSGKRRKTAPTPKNRGQSRSRRRFGLSDRPTQAHALPASYASTTGIDADSCPGVASNGDGRFSRVRRLPHVSVRGDGGDSARAAIWRGGVGGWPSGPSAKVELRHFNRGREEIR